MRGKLGSLPFVSSLWRRPVFGQTRRANAWRAVSTLLRLFVLAMVIFAVSVAVAIPLEVFSGGRGFDFRFGRQSPAIAVRTLTPQCGHNTGPVGAP